VYGTTAGPDIAMGSTGGSASTTVAGNGGGAVRLTAEWLDVSGWVNCNATLAQQPGGGQGSGGSAGGGILLHGDQVTFSGSLTANGSGGSIGTSSANDDGGGGGGGRIKVFYGSSLINTGTTSVVGGPGGQNGGAGQGAPGSAGTLHLDTLSFRVVTATLGAVQPNLLVAPVVTAPAAACAGDSVFIHLSGGYLSYTFSIGGNTVQSGPDSVYGFLADSSTSFVIATLSSCTYTDTVSITVSPVPAVAITVQPGTFCEGDSIELSVPPGFSSVAWSNGGSGNVTYVTTGNTYSVVVTDSNTCSGTDTVTVTTLPAPNPMVILTGNTLSTGNYVSYQWLLTGSPIPGATNPTYNPTVTGTYGVSVTDSNGCTGIASMPILYVSLDAEQLPGVLAWPNPSEGSLHLEALIGQPGELRVQVSDLSGRVLLEHAYQADAGIWRQTVDLGSLAAGVYLLHLHTESGQAMLRIMRE
jgi:hypothetical protein